MLMHLSSHWGKTVTVFTVLSTFKASVIKFFLIDFLGSSVVCVCGQEVEFNQFTTVRDLTTLVNSRTVLPESHLTGFGIFSDWPGVDSMVCCCPFLDTKMVDLIAVWFAALDNLSDSSTSAGPDTTKPSKYQRTIQLAYKKWYVWK